MKVNQIEHIKDVKFLHELIAIAITDARAAMRVKGLKAHYGYWYSGTRPRAGTRPPKVCSFCLAGATIARDVDYINDGGEIMDDDFGDQTQFKLLALDHVREGSWIGAFLAMHECSKLAKSESEYMRQAVIFRDYGLARPDKDHFTDNEELHIHLGSLERMLPDIKEAELQALAS